MHSSHSQNTILHQVQGLTLVDPQVVPPAHFLRHHEQGRRRGHKTLAVYFNPYLAALQAAGLVIPREVLHLDIADRILITRAGGLIQEIITFLEAGMTTLTDFVKVTSCN